MGITEVREVTIDASPERILDVIADVASLPQWSPPHRSVRIMSTHDDGRPREVLMTVQMAGMTDEQLFEYSWEPSAVRWRQVKGGLQRSQEGMYVLMSKGDSTIVRFEVTADPAVPVPAFLLRRMAKSGLDTATEGLRERVLSIGADR